MEETKDEDGIYGKVEYAYEKNLPFVVYRKPKSADVKLIVQKNEQLHSIKDYNESGFVFAPFDSRNPAILFPLSESNQYTYQYTENPSKYKLNGIALTENSKEKHISLIEKGIKFLKSNSYKKVVLSRKKNVKHYGFKPRDTFKKLLSTYQNAFVYCWFHPKIGLWLGATPETLLKVADTSFSTMALAGTQVFTENERPFTEAKEYKEVTWRAKEIEEQQIVTDFILEQLGVDVEVSKPYTVKAGNLLHLRTDISGKLSHQLTLKRIINLLHPTPAICGVPQQEAKEFILENENYNREFYTGFLGELNINNTSNLYVNLRCMQVSKKHLEIYVGGGITKDSNPESEWEETVAKSKLILKVLK